MDIPDPNSKIRRSIQATSSSGLEFRAEVHSPIQKLQDKIIFFSYCPQFNTVMNLSARDVGASEVLSTTTTKMNAVQNKKMFFSYYPQPKRTT